MISLEIGLGLGSIGVVGAALALGIRHGIDWDHIAAITDITSASASLDKHEETWLISEPGVMLTDESHHSLGGDPRSSRVVAQANWVAQSGGAEEPVLTGRSVAWNSSGGAGALTLNRFTAIRPITTSIPKFVKEQKRSLFLGTVYAVGHGSMVVILGLIALLAAEFLPDWIDPIMERIVGITLVLLGVYLAYTLYRYFRGGGEFRLRSRWMLVFAGARNSFHWLAHKVQGKSHIHEHAQASDQYGVKTAFGVGLIHGVGAETGTQVLVIATAVGAASKTMGVAALMAFVVGLIISNSFVTLASTAGFVSAQRRRTIYVVVGAIAAVFSLVIGALFLLDSANVLPELDRYFQWLGPAA